MRSGCSIGTIVISSTQSLMRCEPAKVTNRFILARPRPCTEVAVCWRYLRYYYTMMGARAGCKRFSRTTSFGRAEAI